VLIDPDLFRDDAVSDETRDFNAALQLMLNDLPDMTTLEPEAIRQARREGKGWVGPVIHSERARTITIKSPNGDIDLRIIDAVSPSGVYVHIHGGGWVLGAADLSDVSNEAMATEAGVTVVSIDYRLAPEHPYPAAIDDCAAAARWIITNTKKEFGTDRLSIGGESAGANLAAATLLRTRDDGYSGWRAANLAYGSYLPHGTPSVRQWEVEGLVLDPNTMRWFGEHYVGDGDVSMDDPQFSPLYGRLHDLPPALFTIGTWDPLVDDTLFMASRWLVAGNTTELAVYPGGIHAFDSFPIAIAEEARAQMHQFVRDAISN
jgi:acetyl esterase